MYKRVQEHVTNMKQLSEEYKKIVPTQKVPAFITKEGRLILQSQAIVDYLDEVYPGLYQLFVIYWKAYLS